MDTLMTLVWFPSQARPTSKTKKKQAQSLFEAQPTTKTSPSRAELLVAGDCAAGCRRWSSRTLPSSGVGTPTQGCWSRPVVPHLKPSSAVAAPAEHAEGAWELFLPAATSLPQRRVLPPPDIRITTNAVAAESKGAYLGARITICICRRDHGDHKTKGGGWGRELLQMRALIKKALQEGLDRLVLITLRQLVATVFLAPIAYFKERSTRPKLTLEILVYLFFSAVFGAALSQYTFFYGLQYTTATFAITFTNMSPVLTFLIAVLLRVESLNMKNKAGAAKIAGTLMSFAGVMLLTLYKGVALTHQIEPSVSPDHHAAATAESSKKSWTLGTIALLANCLCFSFWLLLQSRLTKKYPALYSSTAYMFLISSLQGGGLTAAIQRRASVWIVTRPVEIIAVIYTGVMGSGVGYVLMTWCVEKRGPVFTSSFIPIIQIMVAMIDFFFLHENLYLGSVLGSILMILGLYILLWGKKRDASEASSAKEEEEDKEKQVKSRGPNPSICQNKP
ncbi:hypothetical protein BS78_10G006500 [Paspalum vaginatum]|nr:hypothetical protein BS78_10G006500 [Paspalum vaginatum]